MAQSHRDFYTVTEAADALGVSVSTIRRWIADRRLPAFRLGPKALRISKRDVESAGPPPSTDPIPSMRVITGISEIRPPTAEERDAMLFAVDEAEKFGRELASTNAGKPMSDSTELIRFEREKRTYQLIAASERR